MASSAPRESAGDDSLEGKFLTTKQVAALLHVKERKIYELASAGEIPGTRALGKWLFDRAAIYAWLEGHNNSAAPKRAIEPPNVLLGSSDPLLEWAVRESNSGLATFLDGSLDGLERAARREGVAAGIHIHDAATGEWNLPAVRHALANEPVALVEWAWRERGFIVPQGNPLGVAGFNDLVGRRVASRQAKAGSQVLLEHCLAEGEGDVAFVGPTRTETDAAMTVLDGEADAAFGLRCAAKMLQLDFVPIVKERFDLLVWRREWFQAPFQRLFAFSRTEEFRKRADNFGGYDVSGAWTVHFNGE